MTFECNINSHFNSEKIINQPKIGKITYKIGLLMGFTPEELAIYP